MSKRRQRRQFHEARLIGTKNVVQCRHRVGERINPEERLILIPKRLTPLFLSAFPHAETATESSQNGGGIVGRM